MEGLHHSHTSTSLDDAILNKIFRLVPPGSMILIEDM